MDLSVICDTAGETACDQSRVQRTRPLSSRANRSRRHADRLVVCRKIAMLRQTRCSQPLVPHRDVSIPHTVSEPADAGGTRTRSSITTLMGTSSASVRPRVNSSGAPKDYMRAICAFWAIPPVRRCSRWVAVRRHVLAGSLGRARTRSDSICRWGCSPVEGLSWTAVALGPHSFKRAPKHCHSPTHRSTWLVPHSGHYRSSRTRRW